MPPPLDLGHGASLVGLTTFFVGLSVIAVGNRFYCRHIRKAALGWDDWTVLASLVVMLVQVTISFMAITYGGVAHDPSVISGGRVIVLLKVRPEPGLRH